MSNDNDEVKTAELLDEEPKARLLSKKDKNDGEDTKAAEQREEPNAKLLQRQKSKDGKDDDEDVDTGKGLAKSLTLLNGVTMIVGWVKIQD